MSDLLFKDPPEPSAAPEAPLAERMRPHDLDHVVGQKHLIGKDNVLREMIERDLAAGLRPCCVAATVGTTSTTSVDPVPAIADICERHNLWLHVDAAYAGSAAVARNSAGLSPVANAPIRWSRIRTSGSSPPWIAVFSIRAARMC